MKDIIAKNSLIISCQAVDNEVLNDPNVVSKMAYACVQGGGKILRMSQVDHITATKKIINVPIIGLIKKHYDNSEVIITATLKEIEQLIALNVEVIAMDATNRKRPSSNLNDLFLQIKQKYPKQCFMADCSTLEDALNAETLGFDYIGTTLRGYTKETHGLSNLDNNYAFIKELLSKLKTPIIAEGGIWEPEQAKEILKLGVHAVVVGSAITRPQLIVKYWNEMVFKK